MSLETDDPVSFRTPRQRADFELGRARDGFLRAAAALTEGRTADNIAFALLEGGLAMLRLAQADLEEAGHDRAIAFLHHEEPKP